LKKLKFFFVLKLGDGFFCLWQQIWPFVELFFYNLGSFCPSWANVKQIWQLLQQSFAILDNLGIFEQIWQMFKEYFKIIEQFYSILAVFVSFFANFAQICLLF
jgi:hypothetical protein